jgi:hypothetical protein
MNDDPAVRKRVAVFGDSHYACMRLADTSGLVDLSSIDVEYWGHVGRRFRMLEFAGGAVRPTDELTAARFAKFNEKGRRFLPAADFDYIVFMGCRIEVAAVFMGLIDAHMRGQYLSLALRKAMVRRRLEALIPYSYAKSMAALGQAKILLHPISKFAEGAPSYAAWVTPDMRRATPQARAAVWQIFHDEMAQDGVQLLRQPDHTYAQGVYTDRAYLLNSNQEKIDYTHRPPSYGALIWQQVLAAIA